MGNSLDFRVWRATASRGLTRAWPLLLIVVLGLALRVQLGLTTTYLWDEDRSWIVVAESISFDPANLNLPLREGQHAALPAYLIRASSAIAGHTPFGYRLFSILAGALSIALVGLLASRWAGRTAGLVAAALLAFNEYHVAVSVLATERIYYLTFALIAIAAFVVFLDTERPGYLYGAMVAAALAFLSRELAALLVGVGAIALLIQKRAWLRRREPYLAALLFVVLIIPDLWWQLNPSRTGVEASYGDHLARIGGFGLTYQPLVFFGREAVRAGLELSGRPFVDLATEYPTMNALMGALLLAGTVGAVVARKRLPAGPLLFLCLLFWVPLLFFTVVETRSTGLLGVTVWNWSDIVLLPAVLLTAVWIARLTPRARAVVGSVAVVAAALGALEAQIDRFGFHPARLAACPDRLWPADGRFVNVRTSLQQCTLCDSRLEDIRLRDVFVMNDGREESVIDSERVRGADVGESDWELELLAHQPQGRPLVYAIAYEVEGADLRNRDRITTTVRVTPDSSVRARFWACAGPRSDGNATLEGGG